MTTPWAVEQAYADLTRAIADIDRTERRGSARSERRKAAARRKAEAFIRGEAVA